MKKPKKHHKSATVPDHHVQYQLVHHPILRVYQILQQVIFLLVYTIWITGIFLIFLKMGSKGPTGEGGIEIIVYVGFQDVTNYLMWVL